MIEGAERFRKAMDQLPDLVKLAPRIGPAGIRKACQQVAAATIAYVTKLEQENAELRARLGEAGDDREPLV